MSMFTKPRKNTCAAERAFFTLGRFLMESAVSPLFQLALSIMQERIMDGIMEL